MVPERGKCPVFGPERPENARRHAVTTRSHSRGCPSNPWSKAINSSFPTASGAVRHSVPLGRCGPAVLEGHFGPRILLHSPSFLPFGGMQKGKVRFRRPTADEQTVLL